MTYKVYLAGPITGLTFQQGNQWREELALELNKLNIECFNPLAPDKEFDDGRVIKHTDFPKDTTAKDIFRRDVLWILESNLVVANFNAPHFSPGTMWELGYAFGHGIPVLAFGKSSQLSHPFVCMPCTIVSRLELVSEIKKAATCAELKLQINYTNRKAS
jgi:nucleoside 2-deoxyribosyltransferase